MKIVHSLWTRPSLKKESLNISDRNKGGWADRSYYYMSWALSCLQFSRFYEEIELVTDQQGYELLIGQLQLPYTNVRVVLDELNEYHTDLWALGKLYAYSVQEKPFLHVDGDIYIWERLEERIEHSPLVAQNIERGFVYYDTIYEKISALFDFVPEELGRSKTRHNRILAINAGVIGGNNIDFFRDFSARAFEFVDRNSHHLDKINIGIFNTVFEQYLFHAMAEERSERIEFLIDGINHAFDGLAELTGAPGRVKFVHPVGVYKRQPYIGDLVAYHLRKDYPGMYARIVGLLRTHQI